MNGRNNSDIPYLRGKINCFWESKLLCVIIVLNLVTLSELCLANVYKCNLKLHRPAAGGRQTHAYPTSGLTQRILFSWNLSHIRPPGRDPCCEFWNRFTSALAKGTLISSLSCQKQYFATKTIMFPTEQHLQPPCYNCTTQLIVPDHNMSCERPFGNASHEFCLFALLAG
jgi:hypothetical protein